MILKTQEEINILREGGKILGEIMDLLIQKAQPGVSTLELDKYAEKLMREAGGEPAIKGYAPAFGHAAFPATLCTSVNHGLVHEVPSKHVILKEGDILGIDAVFRYKGLYTDMARTIPIGKISDEARKLLLATQEALQVGLKAIKLGSTLYDIEDAIEKNIGQRYGIVKMLVGHGVGKEIHEEPNVMHYRYHEMKKYEIKPGMVFASEPMLTVGSPELVLGEDNWVYETEDMSLAAQFEHTIAINYDGKIEVLTPTKWKMT